MKYAKNILETIGNTPLVKLNKLSLQIGVRVLAKLEFFNPGNSIKDRIALKMIEDAEKNGKLKSGGTIIEGTSGNTGVGLALAAIVKGYKLICVINDKQSQEKIDILRALNAKVVVCPTDVEPSDKRSYYSVSKLLSEQTPNSWYVNQYDNLSNSQTHYEQTGPEIWEQTKGKVTHFVVGVGTGGTISGVGKYLKEQNPKVKIWGVDTYGSVFKKYHETGIFDDDEIYPYLTEGIGEDILPKNVNFSIIDAFTKVTDRDAAIFTRVLAREEGIFAGNSAGAVYKGVMQLRERFTKDDVVVVIFHDHGSRYVKKIFNDSWMKERGFFNKSCKNMRDLLVNKTKKPLITLKPDQLVYQAIELMLNNDISQIPLVYKDKFVGVIDDSILLYNYTNDNDFQNKKLKSVMNPVYPFVELDTSIDKVLEIIENSTRAVLVKADNKEVHIITKHDLMQAIVYSKD